MTLTAATQPPHDAEIVERRKTPHFFVMRDKSPHLPGQSAHNGVEWNHQPRAVEYSGDGEKSAAQCARGTPGQGAEQYRGLERKTAGQFVGGYKLNPPAQGKGLSDPRRNHQPEDEVNLVAPGPALSKEHRLEFHPADKRRRHGRSQAEFDQQVNQNQAEVLIHGELQEESSTDSAQTLRQRIQ